MTQDSAFDAYLVYLENLTAQDIRRLSDYVSTDVRFSDPFHDVRGIAEMAGILSKLFNIVQGISFRVRETGSRDRFYFFRWVLTGTLRRKQWTIEGVTMLELRPVGKIVSHCEYWDSATQVYERFPIIGPLLRMLRARIALP